MENGACIMYYAQSDVCMDCGLVDVREEQREN